MTQINQNQVPKKINGFTLIEMVVVIFVFSMITYGITVLVYSVFSDSGKQEGMLYDASQARRVGFTIIQELRNATSSNAGAYALNSAGDQQVIFFSNIDGGVEVERVRYFIQSGVLKKGVIKPTGNPLTYVAGNEVVTTVQNYVANGAVPLFYYYDDTYTGVTNNFLAQPVDVTDVKYIKLNLRVTQRGGKAGTGYFTVTAGGTFRNLKTNLGD